MIDVPPSTSKTPPEPAPVFVQFPLLRARRRPPRRGERPGALVKLRLAPRPYFDPDGPDSAA